MQETPRDVDSVPGSGRSPEVENSSLFQHSYLENSTEESGGLQSMWPQIVGYD